MPTVKISEAEWEVMLVVWKLRKVSAAEVIEQLESATGWNHRTIRTLLARLVKKGALHVVEDGHRNLYRPAVTKKRCVREAGQSFLERIFAGDPAELLVHFVEHSEMSPNEIEQLKQLLDDKLKSEE